MRQKNPTRLTPSEASDLLAVAREARQHAYAPYSHFQVGAALLDTDGNVYPGVNVENASFGLTMCAERAAVTRAITDGARSFRAIAVAGPDDELPCMPCGACRQVLIELGSDLTVVLTAPGGGLRTVPLSKLLPEPFGLETLRGEERENSPG